MYIRSMKTFWQVALMLSGVAVINSIAAAADGPENFQVIDGVALYLGVLPAQMVQGHAMEHEESKMHGGVPGGRHRDHLVMALFDDASGQRIERTHR